MATRPDLCCVYVIKVCEAGEPIVSPGRLGGDGWLRKLPKLAHGLVALWPYEHAQKTSPRYLPPNLHMY